MTKFSRNAPNAAVTDVAAYFAPRRLGHVNLWAQHLERSERFYHEIGGLMVEFMEPDLEASFLGVGITAHDLGLMHVTEGKNRYGRDGSLQLPGTVGLKPGLNHIAWELETEADLLAAFRKMRANGVAYDMTMDHQIAHSVYIFDPDRNQNEFYSDTTPHWRSVLRGEMGLISGQWDPETAQGSIDPLYPIDPQICTNPKAPLQPSRITHVVLQTNRLVEMRDFYTRIAGLTVVDAFPGVVYFGSSLVEYPVSLILIEAEHPAYHHASFEMPSEAKLDEAIKMLGREHPAIVKIIERPWKKSLFLCDPDGLMSEWYAARDAKRLANTIETELLPFAV